MMFSLISDTGDSEEPVTFWLPSCDLLVTSPDGLPLGYRRLVGAIKGHYTRSM